MEKKRILILGFIGLLMVAGLILVGCDLENCPGNGECVITIGQNASGLYIDTLAPQSSCGKSATWSSDLGGYTGGCKVQNNRAGRNRTYGTHGCNC